VLWSRALQCPTVGSHVKVAVTMSPLAHKLALCSLLFAVVAQTALVGLASAASKSKAGSGGGGKGGRGSGGSGGGVRKGPPELGLRWFAPFMSGGGYSSEAIAFATALEPRIKRFSILQHGEEADENFGLGLPAKVHGVC
jgi:uncharacterized membrane protein YgcG